LNNFVMTPKQSLREAFAEASSFFINCGVLEPQSNAQLLLAHVLGLSSTAYYMALPEPFPAAGRAAWEDAVTRKAAGEPAQYIMGEQEFYGLLFEVTPAVLIPRPETELLVEAVLQQAERLWPGCVTVAAPQRGGKATPAQASPVAPADCVIEAGEATPHVGEAALQGEASSHTGEATLQGEASSHTGEATLQGEASSHTGEATLQGEATLLASCASALAVSTPLVAADIGTGSGAIAVTLAALAPRWRVYASDISPAALSVAERNAARHAVAVAFREGNLLAPFAGMKLDILVSNPPYIPAEDIAGLQREVRDFEPRLALDGGADGLLPYRIMMEQITMLAEPPRLIGFELGMGQAEDVAELLRQSGHWNEIITIPDLAGIDRHVLGINV
jgi:release factor glutamine methyltransferase